MANRNKSWLLPFVFGMFSMTQIRVVGSIGISELVCYIIAPFILIKDRDSLNRNGMMPIIRLSILCIIGCCLASWHNNTALPLFLRGLAVTYSLFALPICLHRIIGRNVAALKWILMGICVSMIINVFVFRQSVEVSMMSGGVEDASTTAMIMRGPLFWLQRVGGWLVLPLEGWYLQTPFPYLVVAPIIMSTFTIMTTESGRSALLSALGTIIIVLVGRKKLSSMRIIQRHFITFVLLFVVFIAFFSKLYKITASSGYLGVKAQDKYEKQTRGKSGTLSILMGGRAEFFMGLYAGAQNPFWGFGPWNEDLNGYNVEFLKKYGDYDAYVEHMRWRQKAFEIWGQYEQVQSHSHIVGFWIRYGFLALPFWIYILYCMYRHIRNNMTAIPQWYGYFAWGLPLYAWHIFFSPYGNRVEDCLFITALVVADAVRRGKIILPPEMIDEIHKKCL